MQSENSRSYNDERGLFGVSTCDDLVLSVLKTPLKDVSASGYRNGEGNGGGPGPVSQPSPSPGGYHMLKTSEDDLLDDVELALSPSTLNSEKQATRPLSFLKKLTSSGKSSRDSNTRFEQCHHRRVPTPIRRRNRNRSKAATKTPIEVPTNHEDTIEPDVDSCELVEAPSIDEKKGIPNPYYPIALPIDQAFKAKYVFQHRRGKTFQERMYIFLEHPCGWLCFVYHFSV
jgi:potassium voltage-gated channel KQT-like subfamily protein 1